MAIVLTIVALLIHFELYFFSFCIQLMALVGENIEKSDLITGVGKLVKRE